MQRRSTLYGRRKGKPLSQRRERLMADVFRSLAVDILRPAPQTLADLFAVPVDDIRLEIGFGGGEHLISEAKASPATGFIGVEPFVEGMAKAVAAIDADGLANIRLHDGDAADLIAWLPAASVSQVDLLYPDPWPKRRHWKRRFVNPANLEGIARILAPGGAFRFASDIDSYVAWTLRHVLASRAFEWTAERADDWRLPWAGWPGTRYEAKAFREGRRPAYLVFRKR